MKVEERLNEVSHDRFERECNECHRKMVGRRENYNYTEAGLKCVTLTNVLVFHCVCGNIVAEIPASEQLHTLIALDLLQKKTILSGEEARYLRKWVGFTATELAATTGYTKSIISRWENGRQEITKEPDRLLRLVIFAKMLENSQNAPINLSKKVANIARTVKSMNLTELLRQIEDRYEGSKPVRINPSLIADSLQPVQ
jgi:putative transcriptional regulator